MRRLVIHGHFYQPPREEPWLELMPRELTAAPDHDWNARITRECYTPLARARVLDAQGRIRRVLNAFAWCSFNVGPTLFTWFDQHAPEVRDAIVAADREAIARTGHGNAIAMPYHHVILPLASRRDKVTEVRWGIRDFRARFGREPLGMWLPETAVDTETLEVLADEGIRFTILAPHQVVEAPENGGLGRWRGRNGRELAIAVYNGPLAHDVAFGDALNDADRWLGRLLAAAPMVTAPHVVSLATDGETFGHHHRFGDVTLASLIDRLEHHPDLRMASYEELLAIAPPAMDVTLVEPTSWSCVHGVERWRRECGCRFDPSTSQAWRAPLRAGLDVLAQGIHAVVQAEWPAAAGDPWVARDAAGADLSGARDLPVAARRLLEAEEHALAMFTSCAWFFDDLARLEPRIVLRHAARALEFLPAVPARALEEALLTALAEAVSNDATKGNGVDIWRRDVLVEADGPARLAAGIAALRELAPDALDDLRVPSHAWRLDGDTIVTHHRRTDREYRWRAEPRVLGVVANAVRVMPLDGGETRDFGIAVYPSPARALLRAVARPVILDATLDPTDLGRLQDGLLDLADGRAAALRGAWEIVVRDGLDQADVLVHAALDLFDLDEAELPDAERTEAFVRLGALAPSPARDALARRFALVLP